MKKLLAVLFLFSGIAFAQGSRYDSVAYGPRGPIPNATIAVCTQPASIGTQPCTPLATLYTDSTLGTACNGSNGCSNPLTADQLGNFHFYGSTGQKYTVQIYGPQVSTPYVLSDQTIPLDPTNLALPRINSVRYADQFTGSDWCAKVLAAATDLGSPGGVIDARGFTAGSTQTCAASPLAGINAPITLITGPYTVQWDPSAVLFDLPPNFHLRMNGTTLLDSAPASAAKLEDPLLQVRTLIGARIYTTTGSITSGQATVTLASTTGVQVHSLIGVWGAGGANANQQTTINQGGGIGAADTSFTVASTSGWDLTRSSDQFVLMIDSEYLLCTGGTATTFTGCTRGAFGTTAATHTNGTAAKFVPLFLAQVLSLSGSVATLDANASQTVTSATVWVGSDNVQIDGQGTIDGAQAQSGTDNNMVCLLLPQATNAVIGPGITLRRCEHGGAVVYGGRLNKIYAGVELNGKPSQQLGTDLWMFGQSTLNLTAPSFMRSGDNGYSVNDRTTNADPWSGPTNGNTAYLPSMSSSYVEGVTIQCSGCTKNTIYAGEIDAATNGILINNSGAWTTNNSPVNNTISFGTINAGAQAIQTSGYSSGSNFIYGGTIVAGGCGTIAAGDKLLTAANCASSLPSLGFTRSGGSGATPDVYGDGTHAFVIGGKADGSGAVTVAATSRFKLQDQGQCTMTAGTCAAQSFGSTYTTAPLCTETWTGTGALAGSLKVTSSTTQVTPSSSNAADTAQVNWMCFGN